MKSIREEVERVVGPCVVFEVGAMELAVSFAQETGLGWCFLTQSKPICHCS